jgi:uncharacterized protein with PIN domain
MPKKPLDQITRTRGGKKYIYDTGSPTKKQADEYKKSMERYGDLFIVIKDSEDEWYNVLRYKTGKSVSCPECNTPMRSAGNLLFKGENPHRERMATVYVCNRCNKKIVR